MRKFLIVGSFFTLLCLISCTRPSSNVAVSPPANLLKIKKIAICRFQDGGNVADSGDIATSAIESAFMEKGYSLVSTGKIRDVLSLEIGYKEGMALEAGMLTQTVLSKIQQETEAQAIIIGSVIWSWCSWEYVPSSWLFRPVLPGEVTCSISISFKMIDTSSEELIVSASVSQEGHSIQSAATKMAKKVVSKIR